MVREHVTDLCGHSFPHFLLWKAGQDELVSGPISYLVLIEHIIMRVVAAPTPSVWAVAVSDYLVTDGVALFKDIAHLYS